MFSWGKSKKDDNKERERQISSLLRSYPSVKRTLNDSSNFELSFSVLGSPCTLYIFIPSDFPLAKPTLKVNGNIENMIIDPSKQIDTPLLRSWNYSSDITQVVSDAIRKLQTSSSTAYNSYQSVTYASDSTLNSSTTTNSTPANTSNLTSPPNYVYNHYTGTTTTPSLLPGSVTSSILPSSSSNTILPSSVSNSLLPASANSSIYNNNQTQLMPASATKSTPPPGAAIHSVLLPNSISSASTTSSSSFSPPPVAAGTPTPYSSTTYNSTPLPPAPTSNDVFPSKVAETLSNSPQLIHCDLPQKFIELEGLTEYQLQRLLDDPIALESQANQLETVKNLKILRDEVLESNAENAQKNSILIAEIEELENSVLSRQDALKQKYNQYNDEYNTYVSKVCPSNKQILDKLHDKLYNYDDASEALSGTFLSSTGPVSATDLSTFMNDYLESRKQYHKLESSIKILENH